MVQYNLFGEARSDFQSSIDACGGAETRDGREMILTFAFQDYMMAEAADGITIDELVHRTLRMTARNIVAQAATLGGTMQRPVPEVAAHLYTHLKGHIEEAVQQLPTVQTERVVIHRDYTRKN